MRICSIKHWISWAELPVCWRASRKASKTFCVCGCGESAVKPQRSNTAKARSSTGTASANRPAFSNGLASPKNNWQPTSGCSHSNGHSGPDTLSISPHPLHLKISMQNDYANPIAARWHPFRKPVIGNSGSASCSAIRWCKEFTQRSVESIWIKVQNNAPCEGRFSKLRRPLVGKVKCDVKVCFDA